MALQTEYEFTLPSGYVDNEGTLHKKGVMRLATAKDEILPQKDPRVQSNPSYLSVILLSRVITRLGSIESVSPQTIEDLFLLDLSYLQELYQRVNNDEITFDVPCPHCEEAVKVDFSAPKN